MQVAEGRMGRVFVLRLDAEDALPGSLERFAAENGVIAAQVTVYGHGSREGASRMASGTLMLDADGRTVLALAGEAPDGLGAEEGLAREAVIQEWLGLHVTRVAMGDAAMYSSMPITRSPGETQAIRQRMLDGALHPAASAVSAASADHASASASPSVSGSGSASAPAPLAPLAAAAEDLLASAASDIFPLPPEPAVVAIYLAGAELA